MTDGPVIEISGLAELLAKFDKVPMALKVEISEKMNDSLLTLWEKVPAYPPKPQESKYRRTGTLGSSLGSSPSGGKTGAMPMVYGIYSNLSGGNTEGRFGTNLVYAKYVISPTEQAYMHKGRWWTMDTIKKNAEPKIKQLWKGLVDGLKRRLGL